MVSISAVSYLNTKPFIYGLEHSTLMKEIDLSLDTPAECAEKLLTGKVDIGLVPVSVLPKMKEYYLLTDFCIGADGPVKSVMLFSNVPLKEIENIILDYQSRTSIQLVKILAKEYWKINPRWTEGKEGYEKQILGRAAGVVIGDRALSLEGMFNFSFDLSGEWKIHTGLPFVFACWAANKKLPDDFLVKFNEAIRYGIKHKDKAVKECESKMKPGEVKEYFEKYISYPFDERKKMAMELFLLKAKNSG